MITATVFRNNGLTNGKKKWYISFVCLCLSRIFRGLFVVQDNVAVFMLPTEIYDDIA